MKTLYLPGQHNDNITGLAWCPNGRQIAVSCNRAVFVLDVASGEVLFCRHFWSSLLTVAWTENGRCLLLGGKDNTLTVIRLRDGSLMSSKAFNAPVKTIAFAPRGGHFLVVAGKTIYVYGQGRPLVRLVQSSPVCDAAWSPTGGRFAAICEHGDTFVYNVLRKKIVYSLAHECEPCSVAWNGEGRDIAIGTAKGTVQMHDGMTGRYFTSYLVSNCGGRIVHLSWGRSYLAAQDEAEMTLWDVLPREQSGVLLQRYPRTQQFAFSPDGEQLAAGLQRQVSVEMVE